MAGASGHRWFYRKKLIERLQILKTAWILGNGGVPQPWFYSFQNDPKKILLSKLHLGLTAFAREPSVTIPVGLQAAIMAEDFDFGNCQKRFGLTEKLGKAKAEKARKAKAEKARKAKAAKKKT